MPAASKARGLEYHSLHTVGDCPWKAVNSVPSAATESIQTGTASIHHSKPISGRTMGIMHERLREVSERRNDDKSSIMPRAVPGRFS
ncbi:hypothetical protein FACUT_12107 [Fusarium acutatum]|uniref:Uncharacterized protein n=1 Tax=Fusarium acutatum TaxID=78861 RepID=A0A8H4JBS0_9HYPO|nr:hypothetical protein FACUT_12107 [Fusarium acutatum]